MGKSLEEVVEQIKDKLRLGHISENQANTATKILYLSDELLNHIYKKTNEVDNFQTQIDILISLIQTLLANVLEAQLEKEGDVSNRMMRHIEQVLNSPLSAFSLKCIVKLDSRH